MSRVGLWLALVLLCGVLPTAASEFPPGFSEQAVFAGLDAPTALRFAPDGRVFVAERAGRIMLFDSLDDASPEVLEGLEPTPFATEGQELLGMALDPAFASGRPYLYLLYTQGPRVPWAVTAPRGEEGGCWNPASGVCGVQAHLSRFEVSLDSNRVVGDEQFLGISRWCQPGSAPTAGALLFDPADRALYVAVGDGASWTFDGSADRSAEPSCAASSVGRERDRLASFTKARSVRDPQGSSSPEAAAGARILRVDPDTGVLLPGLPSPGGSSHDAASNATGLSNPLRITARTATGELWVADHTEGRQNEIHQILDPSGGGADSSSRRIALNPAPPRAREVRSETAQDNAGALACRAEMPGEIRGLQFYEGNQYPGLYRGALFAADAGRNCLFVVFPEDLNRGAIIDATTFAVDVSSPADLQVGPDGLLYYVDFANGRVNRVNFAGGNTTPTAVIAPSATSGNIPLSLTLDGTGSFDPDPGDSLSYSWDLNDNGSFDNHFTDTWSGVVPNNGVYISRLRVEDLAGDFDIAVVEVVAGNNPPTASIDSPSPALQWKVGDSITVMGAGTDPEEGALPAANMNWEVVLVHCPAGGCHTHPITSASGVDQLQFNAPNHEDEASIEVRFTVTDGGIPGEGGLGPLSHTATLELDPLTTTVSVDTNPSGLDVAFGSQPRVTPFVATVIQGSSTSVTATSPQVFNSSTYNFYGWVDDPAEPAGRTIVAGSQPASYLALYETGGCAAADLVCDGLDDDCDGPADEDFESYVVSCGVGACESSGTVDCVGGAITHDCVPGTPAVDDVTCNGIDDDCNGLVDDGFVEQATQCGVGACAGNVGTLTCAGGIETDSCDPFDGVSSDANCDNVDDDCDGAPDDDFFGTPTSCGGLGECAIRGGTTSCVAGVVEDTCDPFQGATVDDADCNGQDDDCDGQTDEDYVDGPNTCGLGECSGNVGTQQCIPDDVLLYGGNRDSVLQRIDVTAETDQNEGTLLFGTQAIEQDPATGFVYYFDRQNSADEFAYYDPATQLNTLVRTYDPIPNAYPKRMAFDPYGTLYMMDNVEQLYTVDKTNGDLTLLGTVSGLPEEGLGATGDFAFAPDGTLYIATYRSIWTLDIDTLNPTLVWDEILPEPEGFRYVFTGIAFCNGSAYVSDGQEDTGLSAMYELSLATGNLTELWLLDVLINDLTTCPANGRRGVTELNSCDPFAGASPDLTCNGLDEDCDGLPDDEAVSPDNALQLEVDLTELRWSADPVAQQYDLVRGDLASLTSTAGDFAAATESCLADGVVGLSTPHVLEPGADQTFWYLVRATNCAGAASWESTGSSQLGLRTSEIENAPSGCP